jgi:hypothetical protein
MHTTATTPVTTSTMTVMTVMAIPITPPLPEPRPLAVDYGRYRIETGDGVEPARFASPMGWGLTLDEIEQRLTRPRES